MDRWEITSKDTCRKTQRQELGQDTSYSSSFLLQSYTPGGVFLKTIIVHGVTQLQSGKNTLNVLGLILVSGYILNLVLHGETQLWKYGCSSHSA